MTQCKHVCLAEQALSGTERLRMNRVVSRLVNGSSTLPSVTVAVADFNSDNCNDVAMCVSQNSDVLVFDGASSMSSPTIRIAAHRSQVSGSPLPPQIEAAGAPFSSRAAASAIGRCVIVMLPADVTRY